MRDLSNMLIFGKQSKTEIYCQARLISLHHIPPARDPIAIASLNIYSFDQILKRQVESISTEEMPSSLTRLETRGLLSEISIAEISLAASVTDWLTYSIDIWH